MVMEAAILASSRRNRCLFARLWIPRSSMNILTLITLSLGIAQATPTQTPVKDLLQIPVASAEEYQQLQLLLQDVDDHHAVSMSDMATAYATDAEQEVLRAAGIAFEVRIEDLQYYYAKRAALDLAQSQSQGVAAVVGGSMGGFKTLAEIEAEIDRLAATYPLLCSPKFAVGSTIQGRTIWGMRISTTPNAHDPSKAVMWYDALHHAREPMSGESLLLFADELLVNYGTDTTATRLIETRNLMFVPCVNPDGYEYNRQIAPNGGGLWRKNRRNNGDGTRGVDLNRNYDWEWGPQWPGSSGNTSSETYRGVAPFSEPETQSLVNTMAIMPPGISMSAHTYSNLMLYPWGYNTIVTPDDAIYRQYGSSFTAKNGWPRGTIWQVLYIANGGSVDYHYGQYGTLAFTPEIGSSSDGFWPQPSRIPALYQDIRPAYMQAAEYTGAWASVGNLIWNEIVGDGDLAQEPGESWALQIKVDNGGTTALDVNFSLSDTHAFTVVSGLPGNLVIPPRASAFTTQFQIDFAANAPVGTPFALDLEFDYDGWLDNYPVEIVLGRARVLMRDSMEVHDFGWSANNATNWSWERANPEATNSGGSDVQSGDDHTLNGSQCWVTGAAAGGSVGSNDVDGIASLTSPRFTLAGFANASLHYARWFANRPGGPLDDRWISEISNDDGLTWTALEDLGDTGSQWIDTKVELGGVLAFTQNMRLRFTVADNPNDDITEGMLDDLEIRTLQAGPSLGFWGEPSVGETVRFVIDGEPGVSFDLAYSANLSGGSTVPGILGTLFLAPATPIFNSVCGADGVGVILVSLPPSVAGVTLHFQAVVELGMPNATFTNPLSISFN